MIRFGWLFGFFFFASVICNAQTRIHLSDGIQRFLVGGFPVDSGFVVTKADGELIFITYDSLYALLQLDSLGGDNWGTDTVVHDATLIGQGTLGSPLYINPDSIPVIGDGWGVDTVVHDGSLIGRGTIAYPLRINPDSVGGSGVCIECDGEFYQEFIGNDVAFKFQITAFSLPDSGVLSHDQIESKILITRNGLKLRYDPVPSGIDEYAIDYTNQRIQIDSAFRLESTSVLSALSMLTGDCKSYEEEAGTGTEYEFTITAFDLVDPTTQTDAQVATRYIVDRDGLIMRYADVPSGVNQYGINFATNQIIIDQDFPLASGSTIGILK